MERENGSCPNWPQLDVVPSEITSLERVDERHPEQVTHGQHKPETIRGDIHSSENGRLVVKRVGNVPALEGEDEPHRIGNAGQGQGARLGATDSLFACHGQVDERPQDHAGTEFIEGFHLKRANRGVEFATNKPLWTISILVLIQLEQTGRRTS